jgi:hypothetical protein
MDMKALHIFFMEFKTLTAAAFEQRETLGCKIYQQKCVKK